ncbi:MAG TPA: ABC transporter permease subunit [Dehalococcoidia bacterium]|nr:ABC transporter permease subunit [Dehalococcoidia bacterium]
MLRCSVLTKVLREQRIQVAGFGLALAVIAALDVFIWPAYRDPLQNFQVPPALQALIGDLNIATAPGFLASEFYSWIPILLIVFAVIAGTGAIAGEEGSGSLDLLLAQPVSRRSLVLQKVAATCIGSALIVSIGYLGFLVSIPFVSIAVSLGDVAMASANMLPITLFFFALSLWLGAVSPSRGMASGLAIGVATVSYFLYSLANGVQALRSVRYASPFYYYGTGDALVHGLNWWHIGLLLGIAVLFVVAALRAFERRDVVTGGASDIGLTGVLRRIVA